MRHPLHREHAVRDAIRRLGEPEGAVARLWELERWKVREVAALLEKIEKSVEHRKARTRYKIATDLARRPPA